jgi:CheY-like chemotaxis protein
MPGMSGVMVAERLKTLSSELPIIMISGYSEQEDVKIAQQKGLINYCLAKPFDLDKINKYIHLVLINNL